MTPPLAAHCLMSITPRITLDGLYLGANFSTVAIVTLFLSSCLKMFYSCLGL